MWTCVGSVPSREGAKLTCEMIMCADERSCFGHIELLFQVVFHGSGSGLVFYLHVVDGLPAEVMFLLPTCLALFGEVSPLKL